MCEGDQASRSSPEPLCYQLERILSSELSSESSCLHISILIFIFHLYSCPVRMDKFILFTIICYSCLLMPINLFLSIEKGFHCSTTSIHRSFRLMCTKPYSVLCFRTLAICNGLQFSSNMNTCITQTDYQFEDDLVCHHKHPCFSQSVNFCC